LSPIIAVAVVAVAIFAWDRLTIGLTFLAREATILNSIRFPLVLSRPKIAELLGCGQCTSAWTGLLAFLLIFPAVFVVIDLPWWTWLFTPLAGPAGTGTFDRLSRMSTARAVEQATAKVLKTLAAGAENDGGKPTERENG
jgi:hypothetical protein